MSTPTVNQIEEAWSAYQEIQDKADQTQRAIDRVQAAIDKGISRELRREAELNLRRLQNRWFHQHNRAQALRSYASRLEG